MPEFIPEPDYQDSYEVREAGAAATIVDAYAAVLGRLPLYFRFLLRLRNWLVAPFGLRPAKPKVLNRPITAARDYAVGDFIKGWRIYAISDDEVITGMDDKHLDFRVSVLRTKESGAAAASRIIVSTAVDIHNLFGRLYLATILPFHRFGVASLLTSAAREGRI